MIGAILLTVAVAAIIFAGISRASTNYYNHQRHLIIMGQPEDPKPWYVRTFEKVFMIAGDDK